MNRFSNYSVVALTVFVVVCLGAAPLCAQSVATQPPTQATVQPASSTSAKPAVDTPRTPRQEAELRGDIFMARKQYADAAAAYEKIAQQEPHNAVLLNKLGMAYLLDNRPDQARKYYERAARADKTFPNPYNNLGTIYYERKKYSKAVDNYLKALKIDPTMAVAYSNLGYAYFHMKKYEEAMDSFRHALIIDPEVFERTSRGGSLLQDRTVMSDPGTFYFFLAKSFAERGDAPQCARFLRRALDDGYTNIVAARTDAAFKPVLRDPLVRELLGLEPLPPEPKTNIGAALRL